MAGPVGRLFRLRFGVGGVGRLGEPARPVARRALPAYRLWTVGRGASGRRPYPLDGTSPTVDVLDALVGAVPRTARESAPADQAGDLDYRDVRGLVVAAVPAAQCP